MDIGKIEQLTTKSEAYKRAHVARAKPGISTISTAELEALRADRARLEEAERIMTLAVQHGDHLGWSRSRETRIQAINSMLLDFLIKPYLEPK